MIQGSLLKLHMLDGFDAQHVQMLQQHGADEAAEAEPGLFLLGVFLGHDVVVMVVTDVIKTLEGYDYFYTCGPLPMLKAIAGATECSGQLSFEERMGCGFGGCMGCSCQTLTGNKRICKEGPVLLKEEIIW